MIKLVRCDDRMIHGQCIVRVLGDFGIERIIGVDDFTASNTVLKKIYNMAVPSGIKSDIYTTQEAVEPIRQQLDSNEATLVLIKNPLTALTLFQAIDHMSGEFNIGPMSSRKDTRKATLYAYLTDEEIKALDAISDMGIRVYFNQTTDQRSEEWDRVRSSMKV